MNRIYPGVRSSFPPKDDNLGLQSHSDIIILSLKNVSRCFFTSTNMIFSSSSSNLFYMLGSKDYPNFQIISKHTRIFSELNFAGVDLTSGADAELNSNLDPADPLT